MLLHSYQVTAFYFKCIGREHRSKPFEAEQEVGKGQTLESVLHRGRPRLGSSGSRVAEAGGSEQNRLRGWEGRGGEGSPPALGPAILAQRSHRYSQGCAPKSHLGSLKN